MVIAIIAILSAALMPALQVATDRSRVTECRSHLTHIGMALRMYCDDQGAYPPQLGSLGVAGFITDDALLACTKTGKGYWYAPPAKGSGWQTVVAVCVDPLTKAGDRPHSFRNSMLELQKLAGGLWRWEGREGWCGDPSALQGALRSAEDVSLRMTARGKSRKAKAHRPATAAG